MLVLAILGGIWIGEFGGADAMNECLAYAEIYNLDITCSSLVDG